MGLRIFRCRVSGEAAKRMGDESWVGRGRAWGGMSLVASWVKNEKG